jgi:hypothetical protein
MSGVAVIRYLLAHDQGVLAAVAEDHIFAGDAPINLQMPALSVKEISGVPMLTIGMTDPRFMQSERVQITALVKGTEGAPAGAGYPAVKQLLALVMAACRNARGAINGVLVDSILPDLEGPDLSDETTALYTQSRDFIVKFNA